VSSELKAHFKGRVAQQNADDIPYAIFSVSEEVHLFVNLRSFSGAD
jgi:hypothetical protein